MREEGAGCCSPPHTALFLSFPSSPSILSVCRDPMCVSQAVEHPFCLFYLFLLFLLLSLPHPPFPVFSFSYCTFYFISLKHVFLKGSAGDLQSERKVHRSSRGRNEDIRLCRYKNRWRWMCLIPGDCTCAFTMPFLKEILKNNYSRPKSSGLLLFWNHS